MEKSVVGPCGQGPVTLPNGFLHEDTWITRVELREMTGVEEDLITDKQLGRDGRNLRQVLQNCITSWGSEDGEWFDRSKSAAFMDKLWLADQSFLLIRLRQLSLDDDMTYVDRCPREQCQHEQQFSLDLRQQPMDAPRTERPRAKYEVTTPNGKVVTFRPMLMSDQSELLTAMRESPDKMITTQLKQAVLSLDGAEVSYKNLRQLSLRDRQAIRRAIEDLDVGVDNTVENTCPKCSRVYKTVLPVGSPSFFGLSATSRSSKDTSTSSEKSTE